MSKNIYDRSCRQCGSSFKGGPRAWYCPNCRIIRRKESDAKFCRKGRKADRPIGSTDKCKVCGKEYIVNSARQLYCPDCAADQVKAIDRVQGLKYYAVNKETINPVRKINRRDIRLCPICGREYWAVGGKIACCEEHQKQYKEQKLINKKSCIDGISYDEKTRSWRVIIRHNNKSYELGKHTYGQSLNIKQKAEIAILKGNFDEFLIDINKLIRHRQAAIKHLHKIKKDLKDGNISLIDYAIQHHIIMT